MGHGMWERWGGEDTGNETRREYTQSGNIRSGTHKEWNIESDTQTEWKYEVGYLHEVGDKRMGDS